MYDELIKRLHRYSENCVAYKLDADFADAVQQAADAIEELGKQLKGTKMPKNCYECPVNNDIISSSNDEVKKDDDEVKAEHGWGDENNERTG